MKQPNKCSSAASFKIVCGRLRFTVGFDDKEGERSIEAVPNVRGIVKFHVGYGDLTSIWPSVMPDVGLEENYEVFIHT